MNYKIVLQYLVLERLLLEHSNSNIFGTELYWSTPIVTLIVTIGAILQSYHIPLLSVAYYNVTIGAMTFYASFYRNWKKNGYDFIIMIGAILQS